MLLIATEEEQKVFQNAWQQEVEGVKDFKVVGEEPKNANWSFERSFGTYERKFNIYESGVDRLICKYEYGIKTAEIYS